MWSFHLSLPRPETGFAHPLGKVALGQPSVSRIWLWFLTRAADARAADLPSGRPGSQIAGTLSFTRR